MIQIYNGMEGEGLTNEMDCCSVNTLLFYGIVAILTFLIYNYFRKRYSWKNLPPGPLPCPIFGNSILFKKDPLGYKRLTALSKQYGSVYRLYCGSTVIVILNGFDAIHEAFVKQAAIFTDRPHLFAPLIGVSKGTGKFSFSNFFKDKISSIDSNCSCSCFLYKKTNFIILVSIPTILTKNDSLKRV